VQPAGAVKLPLGVGQSVVDGQQRLLGGDAVLAAGSRFELTQQRARRLRLGVGLGAAGLEFAAIEHGEGVAGVDAVALVHPDRGNAAGRLESEPGFRGFHGARGGQVVAGAFAGGDGE